MTSTITIPGQLLGPTSKYQPGPGTHIHQTNLYSSLLGVVHVSQPVKAPGPAKRLNKITPAPAPAELPTISVSRSGISEKREVLPEVGKARVLLEQPPYRRHLEPSGRVQFQEPAALSVIGG